MVNGRASAEFLERTLPLTFRASRRNNLVLSKWKLRAMQNIAIQRASEMPESARAAVEQLLGRPIADNEEISVIAIPPQHVPPSESRVAIAQKLEALLDRRAAEVKGIPDADIDAAIDEAVDHVRHSR